MESVVHLLGQITVWHWVGIALVLLTLEVAVGTFDLLWIAAGAFATALFAVIAPAPLNTWQGELVFFGVAAIGLVILGRTTFKGLRRPSTSHPNLNDRTTQMVGQHGAAASTFDMGMGRVKIGDTVWPAEAADGAAIREGDAVVVAGADGTTLKVKLG